MFILHAVQTTKATYENNFDLIRLMAALQVLVLHHLAYFSFGNPKINGIIERIIWNFPGVNVFFIISGYLIFQSVDRNPINLFIVKRLKRIYPGLICCFFFTIILLTLFDCLTVGEIFSLYFLKWIIAQMTIFQFYNPDIVRDFGFGPPNGALWTISVEFQFYILVACFGYWIKNKTIKTKNVVLLVVFILSAAYNYFFNNYMQPASLAYKLSFVFVLSYLYFFIAGVLVYINRKLFIARFRDNALVWIICFIVVCVLLDFFQVKYHRYVFNGVSFVMLVLLTGLVFSIAYSNTKLSAKILKGNDISYGVYIYQMPIINLFFHLNFNTTLSQFLFSLCICITMGVLSWFFVEKRMLNRTVRIS